MGFGLEANARKKRYQAFRQFLNPGECLLTAHHKADQLETILFRIFRGTGIDGLKGIMRKDQLGQNTIFRPLLNYSQAELNEYAKVKKLEWVNDHSNNDLSFDRNYIRKSIIPVIKERWDSVEESLHRLSSIAEENQKILFELAMEDLNKVSDYDSIDLRIINHHSIPRIKNILRFMIVKNNMAIPSMHILNSGINSLFNSDKQSGEIKWSNHVIKKFNGRIYFLNMNSVMPNDSCENISWSINQRIDFKDPLGSIEAKFTSGEGISSKKCSENLSIKFRKGGEKIHLNGSHHSKTLKNFLNERKVLPWVRDKIPLIYDNQELICIGDLWTNQNFIADSSEPSFLIQWNTEMKIL
jgi:tRNA(Ile)-lysidine synthase